MWVLAVGFPFFVLGFATRSWRALLYAIGVWFGLFLVALLVGVVAGEVDDEASAGGDSLFDFALTGWDVLRIAAFLIGLSVLAASFGVVAGRRLMPKEPVDGGEEPL